MNPKERIEFLRKELNEHNYRYYVLNKPSISDFAFDKLMEELMMLEKQYPEYFDPNSPSQRVGGAITKNFPVFVHKVPMLSLSNSYEKGELRDFDRRVKEGLGLPMDEQVNYFCELKIDGLSISLHYENGKLIHGVTRGDGEKGDDVTANVRTIRTIPLTLTGDFPQHMEVRGEIFMPLDVFEKLNREKEESGEPLLANPRNAAGGTMKMQDSREVAKRNLDCFVYQLLESEYDIENHHETIEKLKSWGFKINTNSKLCKGIEQVEHYIDIWEEKRHTLNYETDGVVIKVDNLKYRQELGSTAKSPRWAIAYKYKAEQATTVLESVSFQVGRTGAITPVANLRPVQLAGTVVKRASLHNADIIRKLDLRIGDTVYVEKGGEIIPKIVAVDTSKRSLFSQPIEFIKHCPECGTELIKNPDEALHYCPNEEGCPPQVKGKIIHFASRKAMNIESLGEETVELLYNEGLVKSIKDIYLLRPEQLVNLPRFGKKSAQNLLSGIQKSRDVPFERVLFALGIRHVGETLARKIARSVKNIHHLAEMTEEELQEIEDVGGIIAQSIRKWFSKKENLELIQFLSEKGIRMKITDDTVGKTNDFITGKSFVISGVFEKVSREELKNLIEMHGGKCQGSVSSKTNYLLIGDNPGPEKLKKAASLNIRVLNEKDFFELSKIDVP